MARAMLSLPVQSNSTLLTPPLVARHAEATMLAEVGSDVWYAHNPSGEEIDRYAREARTPIRADLRPRGAHARAFA